MVKTSEKFKCELQRQFYPDSVDDKPLTVEAEGSIREYVKEYSALMLKIPKMSSDYASSLTGYNSGLPQSCGEMNLMTWLLPWQLSRGLYYGRYCPHNGKMIAFLEKHKGSKRDSSSSNKEARMGTLQMVNAFVQKLKEEAANEKKGKKRWGLLYAMEDVAGKTQEALVDTGATHNFMSPRVAEWLGLKPTKDRSWFTAVNAEERPMKGVIKSINMRTGGWTWKADFNIIDMDELGVVLKIDFMEKSSATLNPYCGVMMMVGKEAQPEWMILLVSKDGANARKGITVLQLDKGLTLYYVEWQMGPRTYTIDMLTKTITTEKFKHCLNLIHLPSC
ncbi:hypothetical protein RJ639_002248 [Escallonia herrerae]|uniref:Uncharacterized protein n=1 Tax=Escallonia herrerae TaxID=1293975 RepID=A0AA89BGX4_9ASTE|nr:hypothetical protein RJ639_002248 [Escallonia herrerae]